METDPTPPSDSSEPGKSTDGERSDCFAPPAEPCECFCLHCQRVFMSDGIWFQKVINARDGFDGFWMCPTHNCDGAGFTFDIYPTDPNHPINQGDGGWQFDDDDEYDPEEDEEEETEYDPAEPGYARFDEQFAADDDDDLEGEEWKHGLEPGQRPPEPQWVIDARKQHEEEEAKYDAPDERPRELDWSNRVDRAPRPGKSGGSDGEISEDDIPF